MKCSRCGYEIPEGNIFCGQCGLEIPLSNRNTEVVSSASSQEITLKQEDSPVSEAKEVITWTKNKFVWLATGIMAILLGILAWVIPSIAATIVFASLSLALAIIAICKKPGFWYVSLVAIGISGVLLFQWGKFGYMLWTDSRDSAYKSE